MNDVFERPMPPNPYEKNKTMKLLGKQFMVSVFWQNEEVHKAIEEIVDKAIADNPKAVADYPKSMGFLIGQVMKASKGKQILVL